MEKNVVELKTVKPLRFSGFVYGLFKDEDTLVMQEQASSEEKALALFMKEKEELTGQGYTHIRLSDGKEVAIA